jgi:hypothetical protein
MSNENMSLKDIQQRREQLAKDKQKLDAIRQEEQDLEFREFKLKMQAIEKVRASAKALENDMAKPKADLVIIAYVGSKTTRIDLKNDTVRAVSGLPSQRKNVVDQLVLYMKQQASAYYALLTNGKAHLLAKYNDEQRKAVKQEKLQKAQ